MSNRRGFAYLVVLVGLIWVTLHLQWIIDRVYLYSFHPSQSMAQLINQLDLTPNARAMMYRAQPQIDTKAVFNTDCNPSGADLELGCYYHNRIYILQISNTDLAPEMQVVSAHELLHEAYSRLSRTKRSQVDAWLEEAVNGIHDPSLTERLADYAKSEPGERDNELHSILGTEYANLPPALESYYRNYFADRNVILAAHSAYQKVFASRKGQIEAELATIRALKAQLDGLNDRMNALRSAGQITAYNNLVPQQNALVNQVNHLIKTYNQDVTEYNALSQSLNSQQIVTPTGL